MYTRVIYWKKFLIIVTRFLEYKANEEEPSSFMLPV